MQTAISSRGINRIIDANINRLKEGLRVCEEISRFILDNQRLMREFKKIRHDVDASLKRLPAKSELFNGRNVYTDTGKSIYINELKRNSYQDIFFANIQRAKESARVLEEFSKLIDKKTAIKFKDIRYLLYITEKQASKAILHK